MYCVLAGPAPLTEYPALVIESADETWRCARLPDVAALAALPDVLVLFPGEDHIPDTLPPAAMVPPPWLVACGADDPRCDLCLAPADIATLPARIAALEAGGQLPRACQALLPALIPEAEALLHALQMRPQLGAWQVLPEMIALVTLHPQLLSRTTPVLYPLVARAHGLTPAAVERRVRIAVESAWSTSPLSALDHFFGQSVDPAKGKPTNREFLCQMAEHLRLLTPKK